MVESGPPDKYRLVYITFLIHGIATLLPWNMFITAYSYFTQYKLGEEYIGFEFTHNNNFIQYLTFCAQIPSVSFSWLNIFAPIKGDLAIRITTSIVVNIGLFLFTVLLAMIDTSGVPYVFFCFTMITVVLLNIANAIYQNTIFGMAAVLPPKYTGAIILGNNICGVFTTIISLLSYYVSNSEKMAAIYYFITALFVLLVGFDTYYALPLYKYYRYFSRADKNPPEQVTNTERVTELAAYKDIVKKALPQMYNVWCIFTVTLAIFPALQADIFQSSPNFFITDEFLYQQILCFMTFNVFAVIGSALPSLIIWPSKEYLWIPVTLRILFIPFFLFCNYKPFGAERTLSVFINNDYVYWIAAAAMAITSGYLSSLAMMYAPSTVEEKHAPIAGMFAAAALITGVFSGVVMSFLWPWLASRSG